MTESYKDYIFSDYKASVRVATTENIDLSSAAASVDGVALDAGDRVLVKNQSTATENGIYLFNGEAEAMTRARDANQPGELSGGAIMYVEEGDTNAGKTFIMNVPGEVNLGTTEVTFEEAYSNPPGGGGGGGTPVITNIQKLSATEILVEGSDLTQSNAQQLVLGFSNGSINAYNPAGPAAGYNSGNGIEDIIWTDTSITFSTIYLPSGTLLGGTLLDGNANELASF